MSLSESLLRLCQLALIGVRRIQIIDGVERGCEFKILILLSAVQYPLAHLLPRC